MKRLLVLVLVAFVAVATSVRIAAADETKLLAEAATEISENLKTSKDARQQACLRHAQTALQGAQSALAANNEDQAAKMKKKALRWSVQAVRECVEPGEAPGKIGEALHAEGAMSSNALARFNDLLEDLDKAKKRKKKSGMPFFDGMAINQIMLALDRLITDGFDGFRPQKALKWYLNAAGVCENVQEQINDLLKYLNSHADDTGIVDLSDEGYQQAKKMLDELYKKKAEGAPSDEIIELAEKIKKFLDDQGTATGKARHKKLGWDLEEEERKEKERRAKETKLAAAPVTVVTFNALQGKTNVNLKPLGAVETVSFVAVDEKKIEDKEVAPDFDDHGDHVTIDIGKATRLGGIILTGTTGIVKLLPGDGSAPTPSTGIAPADGLIDVRNGVVNETLAIPESASSLVSSPADYAASLDGNPLDIVATRPGEIAVTGTGVTPNPVGFSQLTLTTPEGAVLNGSAVSWGYDINLPEVTKTDVWVPIMIQVYGLDPQDKVTFQFYPQPGQTISPETVTVPAAEAMLPMPVAKIQAQQPGPQSLSVSVARE